jgi:tetratricopeptide (TPR) repeat protein
MSPSGYFMEKRRHPRFNKRLFVRFGTSVPEHIGFTGDISLSGMFIKTNSVISPTSPLVVKLALSDDRQIDLSGRVRWAKRVPPIMIHHVKKSGMGIVLDQAPQDYIDFLKEQTLSKISTETQVLEEAVTEPVGAPSERTNKATSREADELDEQKILDTYAALEGKNHYQILGLTSESTPVEIKKAYYALAKVYHPDRHFSLGKEELVGKLKALFRRITEAYRTLSSEDKKQKYDFELVTQKTGLTREKEDERVSAEAVAQQGRRALKNGDLEKAIQCFEFSVKKVPDKGAYRGLLAKALTKLPSRLRDAEIHYRKAVQLEPAHIEHSIGLGLLYKKLGLTKRALRHFEEALTWDPDNQLAKEEIRALK